MNKLKLLNKIGNEIFQKTFFLKSNDFRCVFVHSVAHQLGLRGACGEFGYLVNGELSIATLFLVL